MFETRTEPQEFEAALMRATRPVPLVMPAMKIALLSVGALLLRLYRLAAQRLWLDELNTWWLVHSSGWGALWSDMWRGEAGYPLYHLLLKGWVLLAGDSEWALRLPSALAGAAAVAAIYLAAEELDSQ